MSEEKKVIETKGLPKTFMGAAYILEKEPGIFAMYRDILMEENGIKEKWGKPIGPIMIFRECAKEEKEDYLSSRPDGNVLRLWRIHPPKEEYDPQNLDLK